MPALLLIYILFLSTSVFSQNQSTAPDTNYRLLHAILGNFKNFTTDKLQNVYLITPENEVIKTGPDGREQFRYPNSTLGNISHLDATNPFQLLLFFPDYQNVLVLDRTLSIISQFNLFKLGLLQVSALGMAEDGNLWIYDEGNFKLKKINASGRTEAESSDLSLTLGKTLQPNFLLERNRRVFLNDPDAGILVFDIFGKYLKTLDIKGLKEFQVVEDELFYFQNGKLFSFHLQSLLEKPVLLPEGVQIFDKVEVGNNRLYVLKSDQLQVFEF